MNKLWLSDLVRFGLVGVVATASDFLVLNISYLYGNVNLFFATLFGVIIGAVIGYFMNNAWTYRRLKETANGIALSKYIAIALVGLLLTEFIINFFTTHAGWPYNIAKAFAVVIVFIWTFIANRWWTFRENKFLP